MIEYIDRRLLGPFHDGGEAQFKTRIDEDGTPHVVPKIGKPHVLRYDCWCYPVVDDRYVTPAFSHNVSH